MENPLHTHNPLRLLSVAFGLLTAVAVALVLCCCPEPDPGPPSESSESSGEPCSTDGGEVSQPDDNCPAPALVPAWDGCAPLDGFGPITCQFVDDCLCVDTRFDVAEQEYVCCIFVCA